MSAEAVTATSVEEYRRDARELKTSNEERKKAEEQAASLPGLLRELAESEAKQAGRQDILEGISSAESARLQVWLSELP